MCYFFACEVSVKSVLIKTGHSSNTFIRILKLISCVIACEIEESRVKTSGTGVIVQFDELKFVKKTQLLGHCVEVVWAFSGVELIKERKMFLISVNKRDAKPNHLN